MKLIKFLLLEIEPYLIMATIARIFLEGELLNNKSFKKNNRTSIKPDKNYLLLIEQHHANKV